MMLCLKIQIQKSKFRNFTSKTTKKTHKGTLWVSYATFGIKKRKTNCENKLLNISSVISLRCKQTLNVLNLGSLKKSTMVPGLYEVALEFSN